MRVQSAHHIITSPTVVGGYDSEPEIQRVSPVAPVSMRFFVLLSLPKLPEAGCVQLPSGSAGTVSGP
jgi:hypothetical protein